LFFTWRRTFPFLTYFFLPSQWIDILFLLCVWISIIWYLDNFLIKCIIFIDFLAIFIKLPHLPILTHDLLDPVFEYLDYRYFLCTRNDSWVVGIFLTQNSLPCLRINILFLFCIIITIIWYQHYLFFKCIIFIDFFAIFIVLSYFAICANYCFYAILHLFYNNLFLTLWDICS